MTSTTVTVYQKTSYFSLDVTVPAGETVTYNFRFSNAMGDILPIFMVRAWLWGERTPAERQYSGLSFNGPSVVVNGGADGFHGSLWVSLRIDPAMQDSVLNMGVTIKVDGVTGDFEPIPLPYKPDSQPWYLKFSGLDFQLIKSAHAEVPTHVRNSSDKTTSQAPNDSSPLVLDLDGNGIGLTDLDGNDAVYFDLNNDGFAEATGWVGRNDGLLAIDLNEDSIINRGTELFGDQTGYANGFLALRALDSNSDDFITSEDARWDDLSVWVDADTDGYTDEGELQTLTSLGITAINVSYTEVNQVNAGNSIFQLGQFTMNGQQLDVGDAYFQSDKTNSLYNLDFEFDEAVFGMDELRGYGLLPALQIAMSLDNDTNDPDSLISLVRTFSENELSDLFSEDTAAIDEVRDIIFRWASVEDTVAGSRGSKINATELAFLEKLTGQPFVQGGYYSNPGYYAARTLSQAFEEVLNHFTATLAVQGAGKQLFIGDTVYMIP